MAVAGQLYFFYSFSPRLTGHLYLEQLEHFRVPQMDVDSVIRQHDVALPHYHRDVTRYLNHTVPEGGLVVEAAFRGYTESLILQPWTFRFVDS
jgi:hypothetical protein